MKFLMLCIYVVCCWSRFSYSAPYWNYLTEEMARDSEPMKLCSSHPAYEEEKGMFKQCKKDFVCVYVNIQLGTFCVKDFKIPYGRNDRLEKNMMQDDIEIKRLQEVLDMLIKYEKRAFSKK